MDHSVLREQWKKERKCRRGKVHIEEQERREGGQTNEAR